MAKILLLILTMASGVLAQDCDLLPEALEYELLIVNHADQPATYYVQTPDRKETRTAAANSRVSVPSYKTGAWLVVLLTDTNETALRQLQQELSDKIESGDRDLKELKSIQARIMDIQNQMALGRFFGPSCSGTFKVAGRKVDVGPPSALVTSARVGQEWVMGC